ncbi:hypothetical protein EVAR_72525_1 [Eumeta japonica]|uniref:Uncharacterized protein n=1 Tax=Eumeta variegata TaxID=151549 RepID=A0A4C1TQF7_EUMVA|nr:hypothetical protein EVAR_72525_1 [Eumeta japonica]
MVVCKGSSGAVAYQQTILEIPGRVVAVKLRHDVTCRLRATCSDCQASGRLEGRKGTNPKLLNKVSVYIPLQYIITRVIPMVESPPIVAKVPMGLKLGGFVVPDRICRS